MQICIHTSCIYEGPLVESFLHNIDLPFRSCLDEAGSSVFGVMISWCLPDSIDVRAQAKEGVDLPISPSRSKFYMRFVDDRTLGRANDDKNICNHKETDADDGGGHIPCKP